MTSGQNGGNRGQDAQLQELMQAMRQPGYAAPGASASSRIARRAKPSRAVRFSREVMVGALAISLLALLMVTTGPVGQRALAASTGSPAITAGTASATRKQPQEVVVTTTPIDDTVEYDLSNMTLDEKLGQMIMVETYSQSYSGDIQTMVEQMHAGAFIVYKKNMIDPAQLKAMLAGVQSHAQIPLMITMDEEGGNVDRMGDMGFAPRLPSATSLGATGNPQLAYNDGVRAAQELKEFGINVDLAPDVDVKSVSDPVIGPRIWGSDANTVAAFSGNFLNGLQQNGIIGTLKHWPGIGSIVLDPHKTLPEDTRTMSQLQNVDFATFRDLLPDNPGMIMVTHVLVDAIDPSLPSSLSPKVVQGTLRDQLGYQGVIITDNLWMKGVSDRYNLGQAAVLAVQAGDDLLEGPWDPASMQGMLNALKSAVQSGQISQQRIDESVARILKLKAQYGILPLVKAPAQGSAQAAEIVPGEAVLPRPLAMVAPSEQG